MDFKLSEEHRLLQNSVREFAEKEIKPGAANRDRMSEFPGGIVEKMGKLGLMGVVLPTELGGAGLDYLSYVIAVEELARIDASVAITLLAHTLCASHIFYFGSSEQKKRYLPALAKGERLGAWALTEPGAGSDAAGMKTRGTQGNDGWTLTGEKIFTTNGSFAETFVVMASTDMSKGAKGISAFIIDGSTPGLSRAKRLEKLGFNSSDTAGLVLDNAKVAKELLLGEVNAGFRQVMGVLDGGRIGVAAMSVGIGRACLEESVSYAKNRRQFNQPIAEFQAIQWMLSDMATEVDAARLLVYRAARMKDEGERCTKEASMAKLFASKAAVKAATKAVQVHGGYGYIKEYPVERYFRDAKLCEIGEGTSEIQKMVIAREILK